MCGVEEATSKNVFSSSGLLPHSFKGSSSSKHLTLKQNHGQRGGKVGEQGGWKQGDKVEGYCNNAVRFDGDQLGRGGQAVVEVVKNWLDSRCIFNVSQRDFVIAGYVV